LSAMVDALEQRTKTVLIVAAFLLAATAIAAVMGISLLLPADLWIARLGLFAGRIAANLSNFLGTHLLHAGGDL
jgi:hypothetical protein